MLEHGGNLRTAAARFGRPLDEWIDLSAGLNPHFYPVLPLPGNAWHRLPEPAPDLVATACAYYDAPHLLPVAGTQAAIQALPTLRPPSRVVVAAPSYAEHAHHWAQHGHWLHEVAYDRLDEAVEHCDVMVLCNPNNPTGATIAPEVLHRWATQLADRGGWLVVDEAFGDTVPRLSMARYSGQPGLIVLRSLGKFFGLAGARVGFVGAHPDLLHALDDALGPWTISGPAQLIANAALADKAWHTRMLGRLARDGERLQQLLGRYGIESTGPALFQWWPERRPEQFHHHMAERGIWVRLFSQAARGIRLGLPPSETAWHRLDNALHEWKEITP